MRLRIYVRILLEADKMLAKFEAEYAGTPPATLVAPLEDRTRAAWIALWQELMAMLIFFEDDYGVPTAADGHLASRLADKAEAQFDQLRHAFERKHPGLQTIAVAELPDGILPADRPRTHLDMLETLFAHAMDGFDPNDDELNTMEEDALARTGLSREAFMAARSRLRGYVDNLPEKDRRQLVDMVQAARRRRS